eukprot:3583572-Rhodomonas_salina.3
MCTTEAGQQPLILSRCRLETSQFYCDRVTVTVTLILTQRRLVTRNVAILLRPRDYNINTDTEAGCS